MLKNIFTESLFFFLRNDLIIMYSGKFTIENKDSLKTAAKGTESKLFEQVKIQR